MAEVLSKQSSSQPLKCLIVDDEPVAIKGVVNFINQLDFLEVAATCTSAMKAAEILKAKDIDLMFLDINMPMLSGLEFLESLDKAPLTILTTAYSEHALEGFRLNVVDYLMKPLEFQRFFQAVNKALDLFQSRIVVQNSKEGSDSDLYIRQGDTFQRIIWEDILFVEGMQNYLKLHCKEKTFIIHQTMASLEDMLSKEAFFRIHQSYLINTHKIDAISGARVFIDGKQLPISRHRKEDLLKTVVYVKLISK
ncbi:DNA-binding LytR/AlgR family response regulator [Pedobacter sp. W3I1]|uniref:LytR/AlgR family response regulator transcription factor n=1 Tax=Pedobacter sp. W3I1 TaxID=3042291 RepID=UPI002787D2E2|nr:LytTR family DNA-binding domain-containing protein [Pedobacter sp. W3I1]MDQ0640257.1 DNA-binding LytR/AlgR family response regulator [Pedobacter sp. W3I1]